MLHTQSYAHVGGINSSQKRKEIKYLLDAKWRPANAISEVFFQLLMIVIVAALYPSMLVR